MACPGKAFTQHHSNQLEVFYPSSVAHIMMHRCMGVGELAYCFIDSLKRKILKTLPELLQHP